MKMPPVRAMEVRVSTYTGGAHAGDADAGERLTLFAPLSANVNDKGCAFGGSLVSVMTLCAWGLATLQLRAAGFTDAEVYVQDSHLRYLAPLYDDLRAEARLVGEQHWSSFLQAYRQHRKARARLCAEVHCSDGTLAASLEGRFVAMWPK
jgi:thioesterase domain-containing protein